MTSSENAAENAQENNQFVVGKVGKHVYIIYSLVMPTFRTELKCRYNDNTFGHAPDSCWRDFLSYLNQRVPDHFPKRSFEYIERPILVS